MNKVLFKIKANLIKIGEIESFQRVGKQPLRKQSLSLETDDGQKLFCEARPKTFEEVTFMRVGMKIEIDFIFIGSEKNGKQYNNIIIENIRPLYQ